MDDEIRATEPQFNRDEQVTANRPPPNQLLPSVEEHDYPFKGLGPVRTAIAYLGGFGLIILAAVTDPLSPPPLKLPLLVGLVLYFIWLASGTKWK
jgi:hypothetical protein